MDLGIQNPTVDPPWTIIASSNRLLIMIPEFILNFLVSQNHDIFQILDFILLWIQETWKAHRYSLFRQPRLLEIIATFFGNKKVKRYKNIIYYFSHFTFIPQHNQPKSKTNLNTMYGKRRPYISGHFPILLEADHSSTHPKAALPHCLLTFPPKPVTPQMTSFHHPARPSLFSTSLFLPKEKGSFDLGFV